MHREETMSVPCRLREGVLGRVIILHPSEDRLAWSGLHWTGHWRGIPSDQYQICNFSDEQEARDYCREHGLEPQ